MTLTAGSNTQSLVYDASGNLLLQSDPVSGSTLYLGDTELHIASGSTTASAVRTYSANGTPIAERSTTVGVSGSVVKWLATDAQNSASLEVDRVSGAVTRRYTDPFGNTRGTAASWSSGHGFLNKSVDPFTGLDMVGARQYDATLGRFTSVDAVLAPLDPQQNNGYSYAQNNPVTLSDPAGTDPAPAASCNTLQCRNQSYGSDSPAAAGNKYSPVSTHFFTASKPSVVKAMKSAFANTKKEFGLSGHISEVQELSLWGQTCFVFSQGVCDAGFSSQILPAMNFAPDEAGQAISAGAIGGSAVFFSGGVRGNFAVNLEDSYVNLASPERTNHILYGDEYGGGHMYPAKPGKDEFPRDWSAAKIMNAVSDIATDPNIDWVQDTGPKGAQFTRRGTPVKLLADGNWEGTPIRVVVQPLGEGIVSGYPLGEGARP